MAVMLNKLNKLIEERGISRYSVYKGSGVSKQTIYNLCDDPLAKPNGDVLEKLCIFFRIQPNDILEVLHDDEVSTNSEV